MSTECFHPIKVCTLWSVDHLATIFLIRGWIVDKNSSEVKKPLYYSTQSHLTLLQLLQLLPTAYKAFHREGFVCSLESFLRSLL